MEAFEKLFGYVATIGRFDSNFVKKMPPISQVPEVHQTL